MHCFRPDASGFFITNNTCAILLTHLTSETRKSFEFLLPRIVREHVLLAWAKI